MKFGNLLKKELSELITKQTVIMLVFVVAIYSFMGTVMGSSMSKSDEDSSLETKDGITTITLCCQDNSEFTKALLAALEANGTKVDYIELQSDNYDAELDRLDMKSMVIIPQGFGDSIVKDGIAGKIRVVKQLSFGGLASSFTSNSGAVDVISNAASDALLLEKFHVKSEDIEKIKKMTAVEDYTTYNGKSVAISADALQGVLMAQSMIAPFVIFFLLIMASSMIMAAISTEKIDKTLETLLSTPVSRIAILMAKMTAALISALFNAAIMMIGFAIYALGLAGGIGDMVSSSGTAAVTDDLASNAVSTITNVPQAMQELGISLSVGDYALFGVQLFITIAIGLSLSLIFGAMANDAKSVQTYTMPIMFAIMIPFFITIFTDLNSAALPLKIIMYAIPFTHTFAAMTNLASGNILLVVIGIVYQLIFFAGCMFLAVRMFTTDKILTIGAGEKPVRKGGLFGRKNASHTD